uniref:Uncharacterized protein n=1 Tax=Romanomermis culicivorax TaxID=13658 RepID=A0A915IG51_ROMCU
MRAEKRKHPVPLLKDARSPWPTHLVFGTIGPTTIMITRNLGTNCGASLTAKKIVESKPLSIICTC